MESVPGLIHAFGGRLLTDRSPKLSTQQLLAPLVPPSTQVISLEQVHGGQVALVERQTREAIRGADAAVTRRPGMALAIRTADCIPILFAAPSAGVIAAAHAGWRGLLAGVVLETIHCLQRLGASRPQEIRCALGPAIGPCCYEFPGDLFSRFLDRYGERCRPAWCDKSGGGYLDLRRLAMVQLTGAGLRSDNISTVGGCTCCEVKSFHSYRRDGAKAGRQISFILLKA